MRNFTIRTLMLAAVVALALLAPGLFAQEAHPNEHPILAVGSPAPDFSLPGIDGKVHRLADYKKSPLLMVMFICNHCPTSQLYEGRMKQLVADYEKKGVGFVAIEPNDPKAVLLSELGYTDVSDSLEEMKIRAEYRKFNFPTCTTATHKPWRRLTARKRLLTSSCSIRIASFAMKDALMTRSASRW